MFIILWLTETPAVLTVPHVSSISRRGDPAERGDCSFIAPFRSLTLSRLIKHIPTDYAQGDIHNGVTHTQLHTGKKPPTSDVLQGCPKTIRRSRQEVDNGLPVHCNTISQTEQQTSSYPECDTCTCEQACGSPEKHVLYKLWSVSEESDIQTRKQKCGKANFLNSLYTQIYSSVDWTRKECRAATSPLTVLSCQPAQPQEKDLISGWGESHQIPVRMWRNSCLWRDRKWVYAPLLVSPLSSPAKGRNPPPHPSPSFLPSCSCLCSVLGHPMLEDRALLCG